MIVSINDLVPGMMLETDIRNHLGQVLLGAELSIEQRHIGILRTWGIATVRIKSGAADGPLSNVTREELAAAAAVERERFQACDLQNPVMKTLWMLATKRRLAKSKS